MILVGLRSVGKSIIQRPKFPRISTNGNPKMTSMCPYVVASGHRIRRLPRTSKAMRRAAAPMSPWQVGSRHRP
jgi:hypothetical protein